MSYKRMMDLHSVNRGSAENYEAFECMKWWKSLKSEMSKYIIPGGKILSDPLVMIIRVGESKDLLYLTKDKGVVMSNFIMKRATYLGISTMGNRITEKPLIGRSYALSDVEMIRHIENDLQKFTGIEAHVHEVRIPREKKEYPRSHVISIDVVSSIARELVLR